LVRIKKYNKYAKLISGFIYKDEAVFIGSRDLLKKRFGRIDFQSEALDFTCTGYYEKEMGAGLKRRFVCFSRPVPMESLYRIKLYTNRIEKKFMASGARKVNIDPGYLDSAKLVLASTKDYAHRVYLRKNIFAEIALSFRKDSFSPNDWTYPDYRSEEYIAIFNKIRKLHTR